MSQSKDIFFTDIVDIENFVAENFNLCPNEDMNSLDFLVMLSQIHPKAFSEALFNMHILSANEDDLYEYMEKYQNNMLVKAAGKADVGSVEFQEEFRNALDSLDALIRAKRDANTFDEEAAIGITEIFMNMMLANESVAGLVLNFTERGDLLELSPEDVFPKNDIDNHVKIPRSESNLGPTFSTGTSNLPATTEKKEEDEFDVTKVLTDLTAKAKDPGFEPVIGRDEEIGRARQTMLRKTKRNPIFVGEAGVGKTSAAYGLIQKIADGDVPEELKGKKVFGLDATDLVSGTKFRGDFEKRIKAVLNFARDTGAALFIDEIHLLMGAGQTGKGGMDASNIMKAYLSDPINPIHVMGATTYEHYKEIEKDSAFERRFSKVDVKEPSVELAVEMVKGKRDTYEKHHKGVTLTDEAIQIAVEESHRHIHDRALPDKAFDLIDDAMATQRDGIVPEGAAKGVVAGRDIYAGLSKKVRREIGPLNDPTIKEKYNTMSDRFNAVVINQREAVDKLTKRVKNSGSNLFSSSRQNKTLGSFIFAGPTGVGKTELTQQLAKELGVPLLRYDMSEYGDSTSVKRLTGSDPGYVGYEEGGQLVNDVRENPACVVLLDEIEKADTSIYKVLLGILDNAKLTDGQGRVADFQNVYVVMTSNIGATLQDTQTIGFKNETTSAADQREDMIRRVFSPEFVGRLDDIIDFNDIRNEKDIVEILNVHLQPQLDDLKTNKGITVEFCDKAKNFIAKQCLNQNLGARPIKKAIEDYFQSPLVDAFVAGTLNEGDIVIINAPENDNPVLNITYKKPEQKRLAPPRQAIV